MQGVWGSLSRTRALSLTLCVCACVRALECTSGASRPRQGYTSMEFAAEMPRMFPKVSLGNLLVPRWRLQGI